ncbi:hypothetical protein H112_08033 [Trichophyton rubrum D6]|uniref:Uncharacterized protein n=3 Tax=Trichophyton TaxID=5550 RepID=A0A080WI81_TRIRC|nr:uncharacterized protein TERG_11601 [Trichophyton rubrum CBS 118892]EZF10841.1 hypothetical protein H100_08061 [Trichophyton rubrum MR850]EZF37736.1 hypothetical protein H102_08019 [Trichophyton rubrum CBS 100081]EZF48240.1 hypothetical protein H103_08044 [Trichophyton rubrum CBS 288.86]EZF59007.1 hypothetical protein H104_07992 [Trichophyton rubrum CBS 289.86]EZF69605.1 hypothetical protein H105_08045 [Trichophyton soudanense CBS 452.61]EZF80294.1 hypothetical protein H110_08044 [Trichophy
MPGMEKHHIDIDLEIFPVAEEEHLLGFTGNIIRSADYSIEINDMPVERMDRLGEIHTMSPIMATLSVIGVLVLTALVGLAVQIANLYVFQVMVCNAISR